jgi:hypothetical protein
LLLCRCSGCLRRYSTCPNRCRSDVEIAWIVTKTSVEAILVALVKPSTCRTVDPGSSLQSCFGWDRDGSSCQVAWIVAQAATESVLVALIERSAGWTLSPGRLSCCRWCSRRLHWGHLGCSVEIARVKTAASAEAVLIAPVERSPGRTVSPSGSGGRSAREAGGEEKGKVLHCRKGNKPKKTKEIRK